MDTCVRLRLKSWIYFVNCPSYCTFDVLIVFFEDIRNETFPIRRLYDNHDFCVLIIYFILLLFYYYFILLSVKTTTNQNRRV